MSVELKNNSSRSTIQRDPTSGDITSIDQFLAPEDTKNALVVGIDAKKLEEKTHKLVRVQTNIGNLIGSVLVGGPKITFGPETDRSLEAPEDGKIQITQTVPHVENSVFIPNGDVNLNSMSKDPYTKLVAEIPTVNGVGAIASGLDSAETLRLHIERSPRPLYPGVSIVK